MVCLFVVAKGRLVDVTMMSQVSVVITETTSFLMAVVVIKNRRVSDDAELNFAPSLPLQFCYQRHQSLFDFVILAWQC